ncbi:unnamed protein product [Moneuplotes crassus]|uniref:Uncharacterized protein n=1 Tax=Euplotes crassus TaxID=5936 RepID=A0AAD1XLQ4_EUPCR|nr:unnamed protein product [Moneuplotes crassus]
MTEKRNHSSKGKTQRQKHFNFLDHSQRQTVHSPDSPTWCKINVEHEANLQRHSRVNFTQNQ